jgi:2,3-bisphosphoglycerate-independent phosphoglycerate mutase
VALANIMAKNGVPVAVHAFLDGRDTPPKSALEYLAACPMPLATISGRYYAMDRDKRWDRVQKAYDTIASGAGEKFPNAAAAIEDSYKKEMTDEFILPCIIGNYQGMKDGDGVLMANFRSDRAREILTALLDPAFKEFPCKKINFAAALGMVEYSDALNAFLPALFLPQPLSNIFAEIISREGMKQLRIAETEKYAHVTFFFNGGREEPFAGEERILVPSPKVATYDLKPEMAAPEVTGKLLEAIAANRFDVIIINYANGDMVGHSGNIEAASKAVETLDVCLGKLTEAVLAKGGALLITADHGNAEMMFDDDTRQPHTAHTLNLVPAIVIAERFKGKKFTLPEGRLADVAPTLLQLLGLPQPAEMTGQSLLRNEMPEIRC